jgi:hypothetical protein
VGFAPFYVFRGIALVAAQSHARHLPQRRYLIATRLLSACDVSASHSSVFPTPISYDDPAMTGSTFDRGAIQWCSSDQLVDHPEQM